MVDDRAGCGRAVVVALVCLGNEYVQLLVLLVFKPKLQYRTAEPQSYKYVVPYNTFNNSILVCTTLAILELSRPTKVSDYLERGWGCCRSE